MLEPNCAICLADIYNDKGKVIFSNRGEHFVCNMCCNEVEAAEFVNVVDNKILKES